MEATEYSIITAPVPINSTWWYSLKLIQRICLIFFIFFYIVGTLTITSAVFVDDFYEYNLTLKSMQTKSINGEEFAIRYLVNVRINRGFWKQKIIHDFNSTNNDPARISFFRTHAAVGEEIWKNCLTMSIRGGPCHGAAVLTLLLGLMILYFHCTTLSLFRIFMIMSTMGAGILLMVSLGMEYSAAKEYDFCVRNTMGRSGKQKRYVRGRYFQPELAIQGKSFYLMLIGNFGLFIPMLGLGCYLIFFNRNNL